MACRHIRILSGTPLLLLTLRGQSGQEHGTQLEPYAAEESGSAAVEAYRRRSVIDALLLINTAM